MHRFLINLLGLAFWGQGGTRKTTLGAVGYGLNLNDACKSQMVVFWCKCPERYNLPQMVKKSQLQLSLAEAFSLKNSLSAVELHHPAWSKILASWCDKKLSFLAIPLTSNFGA